MTWREQTDVHANVVADAVVGWAPAEGVVLIRFTSLRGAEVTYVLDLDEAYHLAHDIVEVGMAHATIEALADAPMVES